MFINQKSQSEITLQNLYRDVFTGFLFPEDIEKIWNERDRIIDRRCNGTMTPVFGQKAIDLLAEHAELESWFSNHKNLDFVSPNCSCQNCTGERESIDFFTFARLNLSERKLTRIQRINQIKRLQNQVNIINFLQDKGCNFK